MTAKKTTTPQSKTSTLVAVRLPNAYVEALEKIIESDPLKDEDDPDRATVSMLIRKAVREFLHREGKLK